MTTAGHAAAMRQCIADSCLQGRAACKTPMQCSGAAPAVDESIDLFRLHRLQDVQPRTVYLAPGVIDRGEADAPLMTPEDCGLLASRAFWIGGALCVGFWSFILGRAVGLF